MNKTELLKIHVEKSQEKQYLKIKFDVPENVEILNLRYDYNYGKDSIPSEDKTIIDLAIMDSDGVEVGASGSSKRSVTISPSYSTPGFDVREVKAGAWTIICGAYCIPKEGADVTYTIEYVFKHRRYLKGDLHAHTVSSDGQKTLLELCALAKKSGLDFFALTDHNNFFQNKHLPVVDNLTIIPGVELTNYMGHMNFWGLETPYTLPHAVGPLEEFKKLNDEARARGAVISVNHPFCSLCPWKWDIDGIYFDTVEVWNSIMRLDNLKNIHWWHTQLLKGRKLVAVGGSDYHHDYYGVKIWGIPTVHVAAEANSVKDILRAVKEGKVVITKRPNSAFVNMTSGENSIGDSVKFKNGNKITVKADRLEKNRTLVVYNNDEVIHSYTQKKKGNYEVELEVKNKGFVRAEITYKATALEKLVNKVIAKITNTPKPPKEYPPFISCLTNPIYFD